MISGRGSFVIWDPGEFVIDIILIYALLAVALILMSTMGD